MTQGTTLMSSLTLLQQLETQKAEFWLEGEALKFRAPQGVMTKEVVEQLKVVKYELIELLKERELGTVLCPSEEGKHEPFPVNDVQAAYLIGRQNVFEFGGTGCHGYFEIEFEQLDIAKLSNAWNLLIERHDMLRAVVFSNGTQQILPQVPKFEINFASQPNSRMERRDAMSHRVYDTETWPLFDLQVTESNSHAYLHFSIDLLIADFMSIQVILSELIHLYHNPEMQLEPLSLSFKDVMVFEKRQKLTGKYSQARQYWQERVTNLPMAPALPLLDKGDGCCKGEISEKPHFTRYETALSPQLWGVLEKQCNNQGVSPSSLLLTVFSEVLAKWSKSKHFCLNMTVMNREPLHADLLKMVGDFTSVNLLEVDLTATRSLIEQVKEQQNQLWQDLEYKAFSGVEVMRELARQRGTEYARMPIVFTSALVGGNREQVFETKSQYQMEMDVVYGISQTPQVWIDCQIMNRDHYLFINWDVLDGVFPESIIEAMFTCYEESIKQVLAGGLESWDQPLAIALPAKQQQVRSRVNNTAASISDKFLHQLVIEQAELTPESPAVIFADQTLTYQQLVSQARVLATKLPQGSRIAIAIDKSTTQIVSTLAVLIADGVYLPLDVSQPVPRMSQILSDAKVKLVLTQSDELVRALKEEGIEAVNITNIDHKQFVIDVKAEQEMSPQRLAYIIYTSGSTGKPKGVMISHQAAVNTVLDINERFNVTAEDMVFGLAKLSFDLSVYDIFGTLACGATLVLPNEDDLQNPAQWVRAIEKHNVSIWNSVPAQMTMLTRYLSDESLSELMSVKCVMMSGDWIPVSLPKRISVLMPLAKIYSLGGATEAAIWSIYFPIEPESDYLNSIPYGRPLSNQQFSVIDAYGMPCPDWVSGELCIGGTGVSLGYWQDEEKTVAHFFVDKVTGIRWYRTGDRGFYRDDGVLVFVGRDDNQVKIRGYRVELGEIESALERQSPIAQAVLLARGDKHNHYLQAYVEPASHQDKAISASFNHQFAETESDLILMADSIRQAMPEKSVKDFVYYLDRVALLHMVQALQSSGGLQYGQHKTLEKIIDDGKYAPRHKQLLSRWLKALTENGLASSKGQHYCLTQHIEKEAISSCWQACYQALECLDGDKGLVDYLERSSQCLPELLQDKADPLDLLFPDGKLDVATAAYQNNLISKMMNKMLIAAALSKVNHLMGKEKPIRVLEIGAGVGGTSNELIPALLGNNIEYTFTDVSPFFLNEAKQRYQGYDFIDYRLYDFNLSALEQGLDCGQYDLVVSSNVLHNAVVAREGLNHLRELLKPGGWLLVIEATRDNYQLMTSMEFKHGLTAHNDERVALNSPFMPQDRWLKAMEDVGAEQLYAFPNSDDPLYQLGQSFILAQFNGYKSECDKASILCQLAADLPSYMMPGQLAILDRLPLTNNGKVARQALSEIVCLQDTDHTTEVTELDELETILLSSCRDVIGNPNMGVYDDFFSAGGDSLLITQWVSRIRQDLGEASVPWEGTLRQVLQTPTIKDLAVFLRQQSTLQVQDTARSLDVVGLQCLKEGEGEPIIIIHDGGGTVMPCLALVEHLAGPVFGVSIQNKEEYLTIPSETLIVELAGQYKSLVAEAFELEQCHVFGFCMGGLIAFELARQAMESGAPLASLTIASSYQIPYTVNDPMVTDVALVKELGLSNPWSQLDLQELEQTYLALLATKPNQIDIADIVSTANKLGFDELANVYASYAEASESERMVQFQKMIDAQSESSFSRAWYISQLYPVFHHSLQAVTHYQPSFYSGDLTFACQLEATYLLPTLKADMHDFWQQYCIGEVQSLALDGDHFTCMLSAQVQPLAMHLNNIVKRGNRHD
ncbi:non-ribosomal peptide synthetase [Photobacterium sanguinicancri]|uniref:L-cysteine--[L-cysteinyl-carrier protein] ligase n=1 Tax=Photobacterium sanguinicancri TaxID=875932 RepID=A0AAW7YAK5_9GAMM|nr:non-ribosomal peptide synthetase [Photobacterium sanguinicancri]MDO6544751.1 amino acid adenylation domain-containing protein [Photobacterium sanguinicancri]